MPVAFDEIITPPPPDQPPRRRWTRAECEFMMTTGLWDGEHLELIDGELINKMGKKRTHVTVVTRLYEWLIGVFGLWLVQKEESIDVASGENQASEPEPDLTVLRRPLDQYTSNPGPEDVLLAVEVAESSLSFDLTKKANLYARAGIPDYWVFDTNNRQLIVHREPVNGKYSSVVAFREHESVAPLAAPKSAFRVHAAFESL